MKHHGDAINPRLMIITLLLLLAGGMLHLVPNVQNLSQLFCVSGAGSDLKDSSGGRLADFFEGLPPGTVDPEKIRLVTANRGRCPQAQFGAILAFQQECEDTQPCGGDHWEQYEEDCLICGGGSGSIVEPGSGEMGFKRTGGRNCNDLGCGCSEITC